MSQQSSGYEDEGFKDTQLGKIPADWHVMQLRELGCEFVSGDTPARSNPEYYGGDIPWLKTSEVQNNRVASSEEFITEKGVANASTKVVESGAVLVAMYGGGTVGNIGLLEIDAATNQACCAVLTDESKLSNEFLYHQLLFEQPRLVSYAAGSSQQNLSKSDVEQFTIRVPPLPEQCRIADVLSMVDERIREAQSAIESANDLKRGLMQDLLLHGIDHERFKEQYLGPRRLEMPENWQKVRMDEVTEVITRGKQPTYVENGGVPVLNQSCIYWDGFHPDELKYLDSEVASDWKDKYWVKNGDVLINSTGKGTLGRALEWMEDSNTHALDSHITRVHPDESVLDPTYLRFYLESNHGQKMLYAFCVAGSTGQIELSKTDLQTMPLLLPPIDEQKDISEAFHRANNMMGVAQEEKSKLQELKRGLMQDLLTGNRRLKVDT